jgi:ribosome biogenesis GTPase A
LRDRSQSESKKKVKINDVPEYAPQVAKQVNKVEPMQFINKMTGGGHKQKTIIVIMPVGIPGMGKSTFVET